MLYKTMVLDVFLIAVGAKPLNYFSVTVTVCHYHCDYVLAKIVFCILLYLCLGFRMKY